MSLFSWSNGLLLSLFALITVYPLWHETALSLSSMQEAMKGGLFYWPRGWTWSAYVQVLHSQYLWLAYRNSILVTVGGALIGVVLTAATAYPLTKRELPGRNFWIVYMLFTMLFSGGIIPTYLLVKSLGMINSLWSLMIPTAISAFNVIVMMSFFRTLPTELEDAASIDGANPLRIFATLVIPLSKPVLATVALWEAIGLWNNYLNALFYLNDKSKYVLPVLLKDIIQGQILATTTGEVTGSSTESVIAATIVLSILPIIGIYPFLQKYFIGGTLIGSVKS